MSTESSATRDGWVRTHEHGPNFIESLNGLDWYEAPLPPRWHRCKAQTRGYMTLNAIARCACGATYIMGGWIGKNETRNMRRRRGK